MLNIINGQEEIIEEWEFQKGGCLMDSLLQQIGNFGFPMVVSIYLLVRVEGNWSI